MKRAFYIILMAILALTVTGKLYAEEYAKEFELDFRNIVVVLDASGSMNEYMSDNKIKKIDAAKNALEAALNSIPDNTQVGLLVFSSQNLTNDWAYPLGPLDRNQLIKAIHLPIPQGSTPLGKYIKKGADRLLAQRVKQFGYGDYRLLIVTDGEASDQAMVDKYAPEVISRGIIMDVIGVDMTSKHTLATIVHSYRRADDPNSLKKALSEIFAEVSTTKDTGAVEDAFAQIEPLTPELALEMIKALSLSSNDPIGAKPIPSEYTLPDKFKTVKGSHDKNQMKGVKKDETGFLNSITFYLFIVFILVIFVFLIRKRH